MSVMRSGLVALAFCTLAVNAFVIKRDDIVLSPAANDSLPTNWTYVGCYNESGSTRTLSGGGFNDAKAMNGSACTAYCAKKNFVYAGTEYGEECYCGNKLAAPSSLQNDTKCSMPCSGNSSEACGAGNFLSIYFANKDTPIGPSVNPGPSGWTSYGCWQDPGNPRTLGHTMNLQFSNMTVALCTSTCASNGYTLSGVEYSGECYCDNYLSKSATNASIDDCNMVCNGNASEFCGAGNRLNLYASGNTVPGPKPANMKGAPKPINWVSQGCYSDNVGGRTLGHGMNVPGGSQNMTNANCAAACLDAGYTIAGTEYSGECFCDNDLQADGAPVTDGRCSMECNGNSADICGGPNGLSMMFFNGWYSQGCWAEGNGGRVLTSGQNVVGGTNNMTVENCCAACKKAGYKLAGVEYAGECWCGNSAQSGGGPAPDGNAQCNMPCNGNADEMCGGPNRLNVYQFDNSNLYVPPTPTSSSTTAAPTTTNANNGGGGGGGGDNPTPATTTTSATVQPSSPVDPNAIKPFKYQGCYTDTSNNGRSLTAQMPDNQTMTVESCINACSAHGYKIAGMQYGVQCFCDNYFHNSPQLTDDSDCNMACPGNAAETCGAGGRNSVYVNGTASDFKDPQPLTTGLPGNWTYTGCFSDNVNNNRVLPYMMTFSGNNSNIYCMTLCQQFGYGVAGTEYGEQCFCGDTLDYLNAGSKQIANSSCNTRCTNDTQGSNGGEICGGGNAISLYTWGGTPQNSWTYATGDAAGRYELLIGGVTIPLLTQPARNGKVTFLEKFGTGPGNDTGAYELDLAQIDDFSKAWRPMHVQTDVFCSAGITMPDRAGRQLNVGGWSRPSTEGVRVYWPDGKPGTWGTNDWEEDVDNVHLLTGRWYPSAMVMSNGSILVMGGEEGSNGAPVPSLEVLPSPSGEILYCDYLERTDPNNLYPFLAVLPSGNIFVTYYNEAKLLDPVSLQPIHSFPNAPGAVNNFDAGRTYPYEGTAVILPQAAPYSDPMEVLICGGSTPGAGIALDNCVTIAPDTPNANWTLERMPSKRVMPCMCGLPDGTYIIANGAHQGYAGFGLANDPNLNAVLYDPSKPVGHRMTVMANTTVARLYHSEAILLDDGRVLISGSDPEDGKNPQEYRVEVFIPPYLMGNPSRPAMNISNIDLGYGDSTTMSISAPGAGGPYRVSMMGAISSTHGNSMGQRTYFLAASCSGSSCTITAPPNAKVCPPGWFQVFLVDSAGVPSHAQWIRVGGDPASLGNWPDSDSFTKPGMGPVQRLF